MIWSSRLLSENYQYEKILKGKKIVFMHDTLSTVANLRVTDVRVNKMMSQGHGVGIGLSLLALG